MKIPSYNRCIQILKENDTPKNIWLHNRKVNAIAMFIANKLIEKGININIDIVDKACLLHDVKKFHEIKGIIKDMHENEGKILIEKEGYPEIADLISKHKTESLTSKKLKKWEEKVVFYSDKRVMHDKIVSIDERMEDGWNRYKDNTHYSGDKKVVSKLMHELEKQIFKKLSMKPEDINEKSIKSFLIEDDY
jgi:uncharacterized protein